ncbi:MAG: DsbE family thiol:disulfide interchange protein [Gammaproteobacteria bacterium]
MFRLRFLLPLGVFLVVVGFFFVTLRQPEGTREALPSPLINKAAPDFRLTQLHEPNQFFTPADARGKVWLLNVWASWCVSCRQEHPVLMELSRAGLVPIYGLNYKDKREDSVNWLAQFGNPYVLSAVDGDGRVGIDYGVYGAPETYVIDKKGIIRYKHIGPVSVDALQSKILPLVQELEKS